jgi:hypothetical protein
VVVAVVETQMLVQVRLEDLAVVELEAIEALLTELLEQLTLVVEEVVALVMIALLVEAEELEEKV